MNKNSMIAYFNDEEIIKTIIEDGSDTISIYTLDNDGEEVEHVFPLDYSNKMKITFVNNTTSDVAVIHLELDAYGLSSTPLEVKAGTTVIFDQLLGTPDGNNYVTLVDVNPNVGTITYTDAVNCMEYGSYLIVLDATQPSSVTATIGS